MITTADENGVWNNYASEPEVYFATYPSPEQQGRYWFQGGLAVLLVSTLTMIALSVS